MAKKEKTPEHEAVARARRKPERWWHMNRHTAWVNGETWGFFTNYRGFSFACGCPKVKFHGDEVPESQFNVTFDWRPFRLVAFWQIKRILWVEDWEWKKHLRSA